MPKAEAGTPKAIANRIKAKGLQKLRWYCQMCEKQCRDENGFKCHCASPSHQRQMALFAQSPGKFLDSFSQEFETEFVRLLSRRYGTKKVFANQVYQEIVANRTHLHMNATKWTSLTGFVQYLGRKGVCHVDETPRGWFIEWIDNSPAALARREAILKKDRQATNDEEREKKLISEQVKLANLTKAPETEPITIRHPPANRKYHPVHYIGRIKGVAIM
ncbi:DNA/RNA-binding protein KIN17 [Smittium mucronatum]|uniref:DNA/RNA-binding protein KIN17 n=1 Tax=Smittium mucronatum TaxID=133383 RepID=A0A1R0H8Q0_9FUNG|nr:DNA/RNA-binding protein KIN17 [Smittium mucronatum]